MEASPSHGVAEVERTFREAYGQAVATLVRIFGDISKAEDAVQDAFLTATQRWTSDGIPPNPAGWIITTARNRAIDVRRRESRGGELLHQMAAGQADAHMDTTPLELDPVPDDQLRLMFTCCHPALRQEHQVALTLRLLGGLSVGDVANAFLVSEATMAKRLTRAKYKIKAATIPYRVPSAAELPTRLQAVLTVIYLIYNAGADLPDREPLRREAIRLGRELVRLMPDEPEAVGLLALMLLNESRMAARWADGEIVLLADQDRGMWDQRLIAAGQDLVRACIRRDQPGPFQLQAAIQAIHADSDSPHATDWSQVVANYDRLLAMSPTSVVALNRAIALGERDGPPVALAEIEVLSSDLDGYYLFHSARAEMLLRLGRTEESREAFTQAGDLAPTETARRHLENRIAMIDDPPRSSAPE